MVWVLGVLAPPEVRAQGDASETPDPTGSRERARVLALEGIERFEQERWAEAHERLKQAFELFPAPTVALLDAKALEKMGRLLEAHATFQRAAALVVDDESPKPFRRAVSDAARERDRVAKLIPSLSVAVRGATPSHTLEVNGVPLASSAWGKVRQLDPGSYTVVAKRGTVIEQSEQLNLEPGARVSLVLALSPEAPPVGQPAPASPTYEPRSSALTWTALGVGAAGLATGVIAGIVMQNAKNGLDDACTPTCPDDSRETLHRFRTARTVSAVGYSAGVVSLGIGLWLLFDDSSSSAPPVVGGVSYRKGSAELQLSGAF
jgi:hypothetical protein